eukprot:TRINITY_DN61706_c0_g1_i1.p1 TRINITY_DN61706_c0_g1~~TRINITY_DN61706_c0_g1_i1.p1  ORF type:complete len:1253 (+),score=186.39 TRINITY_DN61706_c0_g1_i1:68-3826(+)
MGSGVSVAAEARKIGNAAFKEKDHKRAIEAYTRAIDDDGNDAKLYTNRAAAYAAEGRHGFAYYDAERSVILDRSWHKGYFRLGQALLALGASELATDALRTCSALVPGEPATQALLEEAEAKRDSRALRGYVLSWGSDEHGNLGHRGPGSPPKVGSRRPSSGCGGRQRESAAPRAVEELKSTRCVDVACGIGHNVAVTATGKVLAWGLNSTSQCGDASLAALDTSVGTERTAVVPSPALLPSLLSVYVVAVACGAGHSVVLTDGGVAWVWGLGANGQLGLGAVTSMVHVPKRVDALEKSFLIGVACGFAHTMVVDKYGQLFGFGWNSQGQVGVDDPSLNVKLPAGPAVPLPAAVPGFCRGVQHVACGGVHTAVVLSEQPSEIGDSPLASTMTRTLSSVGKTTSSQSLRSTKPPMLSRSSSLFEGTCNVADVKTSDAASTLWCFGSNSCGQLGIGRCSEREVPQRIALGETGARGTFAALAVCGEEYSFGITVHRDVFAWGLNNVGQLGLPVSRPGDETSVENYVLNPARVSTLSHVGVEWIVSGQGVSFAVTQDGSVWAWGLMEVAPGSPPQTRLPEPSRMFGQHEVVSIAAGRKHFCSLCRAPAAADGELVLKTLVAGLRAGRRVELEATLRKPTGDTWKVGASGQAIAAFVVDQDTGNGVQGVDVFDNMDGTFGVTFKPPDAGAFLVHCFLAGQHLRGSPLLVEVEAGGLDLEKSVCTLFGLRRVRCGDELTFYVVARDAQDNYLCGGRQRAAATIIKGGAAASASIEDYDHGQSRLTFCWHSAGERRLAVSVGEFPSPPVEIKQSIVEVVPAAPSPAHFVIEPHDGTEAIVARSGDPCTCWLLVRDRFGNATDEMLPDLDVHAEGPQGSVLARIKAPPPQTPPSFTRLGFGAWRQPTPEKCRLEVTIEVGIAGSYRLIWSSASTGESGQAPMRVQSGRPDPLQCYVTGIESRVFTLPKQGGHMPLTFGLVLHDEFGNRVDNDSSVVCFQLQPPADADSELFAPQDLKLVYQGEGTYAATGHAGTFGQWQLTILVDGRSVLGSPFVIHLDENPAEILRRQDEERQKRVALEEERQQREREADAERQRRVAQENRVVDSNRDREEEAQQQQKEATKQTSLEEQAYEQELEKRRKLYERMKREEQVRKRAEEALRREVEERRAKARREKEMKEKRCGGGFVVMFRGSGDMVQSGNTGSTQDLSLVEVSPPRSPVATPSSKSRLRRERSTTLASPSGSAGLTTAPRRSTLNRD